MDALSEALHSVRMTGAIFFDADMYSTLGICGARRWSGCALCSPRHGTAYWLPFGRGGKGVCQAGGRGGRSFSGR